MLNKIPHAFEYLAKSSNISTEAVEEDQVEEIESYMSAIDIEDQDTKCDGHYLRELNKSNQQTKVDHTQLKDHLKKASKHITVTGTQSEYRW
jgi:hypothetical protein